MRMHIYMLKTLHILHAECNYNYSFGCSPRHAQCQEVPILAMSQQCLADDLPNDNDLRAKFLARKHSPDRIGRCGGD